MQSLLEETFEALGSVGRCFSLEYNYGMVKSAREFKTSGRSGNTCWFPNLGWAGSEENIFLGQSVTRSKRYNILQS
jgi:hypothetical protein